MCSRLIKEGARHIPISRRISDIQIAPEQRHILELAFKHTLRKLDLVDRNDPVCDLVARKMLDVYKRGVTDAVALTEITIREIGIPKSP